LQEKGKKMFKIKDVLFGKKQKFNPEDDLSDE
jgi:hypothetical protein